MFNYKIYFFGAQIIFALLHFSSYGQTQNFTFDCDNLDTLNFISRPFGDNLFIVDKRYSHNKKIHVLDLNKDSIKSLNLHHPPIAFSTRYPLSDLIILDKYLLLVYPKIILKYQIVNKDSIIHVQTFDLLGDNDDFLYLSAYIDSLNRLNIISVLNNNKKSNQLFKIINFGEEKNDSIVPLGASEMRALFHIGPSKYFNITQNGFFGFLNSVKQEVQFIYPFDKQIDLSPYLTKDPYSFFQSQQTKNHQKRISSIFSAFPNSDFDIPLELHMDENNNIYIIYNIANKKDDFEGGLLHLNFDQGIYKNFDLKNRLVGTFFIHGGMIKKVVYRKGRFEILDLKADLTEYEIK
jgi:hypothetical protein